MMPRRQIRSIIIVGLLLSVTYHLPLWLPAEVPRVMNYQGLSTDDAGVPLDGDCHMVFSIYDTTFGGIPLLSETHGDGHRWDILFSNI
jgi:hypothetical protein